MEPKPPGLRERNVPLAHETGGEICGGTPNTKLVFKAISQFDTVFKMKDTIFDWLDKKRAFKQQLRMSMPAETLYTLVSVFSIKAKELRSIWEDMLDKESYYTSMEYFLREVERAQYPDVESASYVAFSKRKQKPGEGVKEYWLGFKDLAKQQKIDPSTHAMRFISSVTLAFIRLAIRVEWYKTNDLEKVVELADQMEQGMEIEKEEKEEAKEVTAASVAATTATKQKQPQQQQPQKSPPPSKKPPPKKGGGKKRSPSNSPTPTVAELKALWDRVHDQDSTSSKKVENSSSSSTTAPKTSRNQPSTKAEEALTRLASN